jgi:hypothetical protein
LLAAAAEQVIPLPAVVEQLARFVFAAQVALVLLPVTDQICQVTLVFSYAYTVMLGLQLLGAMTDTVGAGVLPVCCTLPVG